MSICIKVCKISKKVMWVISTPLCFERPLFIIRLIPKKMLHLKVTLIRFNFMFVYILVLGRKNLDGSAQPFKFFLIKITITINWSIFKQIQTYFAIWDWTIWRPFVITDIYPLCIDQAFLTKFIIFQNILKATF